MAVQFGRGGLGQRPCRTTDVHCMSVKTWLKSFLPASSAASQIRVPAIAVPAAAELLAAADGLRQEYLGLDQNMQLGRAVYESSSPYRAWKQGSSRSTGH